MLNKELLLATGSQTKGYIKLVVGWSDNNQLYWYNRRMFGYSNTTAIAIFGSISKAPCWNVKGKPFAMQALSCDSKSTILVLQDFMVADDIKEITVTVVEKKLTATLKYDDSLSYSTTDSVLFNSTDLGKSFTIVFDPEPTGYV